MTTEVAQIVVAASVPIVTAVLGVLGIMFQDWRVRRTQAGQRKLALEDASRQASFAAEWWNARRLLADSPEAMQQAKPRALAWLEEASALVMESRPPPAAEKPPITLRRLLLLYPLQRRAAKIIRGIFYVCLGFLITSVGSLLTTALAPSERQYISGSVAYVTGAALLTLALRFYVGFVEEQRPEHKEKRRVSIRQSFLFYRLHRRIANIVRVLFYVWLAFVVFLAVGLISPMWTDPSYLPGNLSVLIASIGYAVGLRYWAASLGRTREAKAASSTRSSLPPPS